MTDLDRNSKADTRLFCDAALADFFVDHSQYRTNIAESVGPDSESLFEEVPSPRTLMVGRREISVYCYIDTDSSGTVLSHGELYVGLAYQIYISHGIVTGFEFSGYSSIAIKAPDLGAGGYYYIHWCTTPTAENEVRAELMVVRADNEAVATACATYAIIDATETDAYAIANYGLYVGSLLGGLDVYTGYSTITKLRIGRRFHSTTEGWEDWIGESAAPSISSDTRLQPTPIDASTSIDGEGSLYGPAILQAAYATEQADMRLWGPIVNEVYEQDEATPAISSLFTPARHSILAPGSTYLHLLLRHLWQRPVPPGCTRARVRVHITAWPSSGTEIESIQLQLWAFNRNPWAADGAPLKQRYTSIETRATNDGSATGGGGWVDLGNLTLPVLSGFCMFVLGVGIGEGADEAGTAFTRVRVNAVTVEPTQPAPLAGADDLAG